MPELQNFDFDKEELDKYIDRLNIPKVLIIGDMGID